ncbi:hypothetical protein AKUH4B114J_12270 [Apilactobacillus kunkeei]|uniref:hypothetical protein n=1 Tax=Apilactobacillus kunkeei TaxID=148814 RepID=UPI001C6FB341|nr:hypothetical protein [Apilactobacillus kunkeei]MBX8456029.1 hypothetical protein [Apilactobacillus kunkeei]QYU54200.1 hypothetical protein K2W87_06095 [Apilactobacillus kunkeei]CAI2639521.1 hypothetical protein AKUH3B202M_12300 [Apilactobacillus kunkeei]CAI2641718.1 hypothetical protein AKUH3B203M01_04160 [Apilactobacillus kunkeei]CAI2642323.1 hypothetical protein AKUH3B203M_11920 [Apilactobacillus kunkeei]
MKKAIKFWPYMSIFLVAVLIMLPQIVTGSYILGVDSIFHMNRFYDAAMQLKTGHLSYFISIYGYQQSGRIINALYGPLAAYFNGLILLITGNWVRYQIVASLLTLCVSGMTMYNLAIRTHIKKIYALFVGIAYMSSYLIMGWVVGMQFTGWGAALLPWLLAAGFDMVDYKSINILKLAMPMSILLQTHMLSSLTGALALVPMFTYGVIHSGEKLKMWRNAILSFLLTLCLTANVWYGMMQISLTNHALGVAPQLDMYEDSVALFGKDVFVLPPIYSIGFIIVAIYFAINFKKISSSRKIIFITGLFFMWISSVLFPWGPLDKKFPSISYLIQMPRRFVVIPFILLLICAGIMINDTSKKQWINSFKNYTLLILTFFIIYNAGGPVRNGVHHFFSPKVVQNDYNLHYQTTDTNAIRNSLSSHDTGAVLKMLTKATPDYLPVQYKMTAYNYFDYHPYGNYGDQIINYKGEVEKTIKRNGHLLLTWDNDSDDNKSMQLPIFKYDDTKLILNGKHINNVKQTQIGSVIVNSKPGHNKLEIYYHATPILLALLWVTVFSWIGLIAGIMIYLILRWKKHIKRSAS